VRFSNSVTSLEIECFSECSSLTSIAIFTSLTSLESRCFFEYSSLPTLDISSCILSIEKNSYLGIHSNSRLSHFHRKRMLF
jgi:hypothetical protein